MHKFYLFPALKIIIVGTAQHILQNVLMERTAMQQTLKRSRNVFLVLLENTAEVVLLLGHVLQDIFVIMRTVFQILLSLGIGEMYAQ